MNYSTIAVIGGTGRSGKHLIRQLIHNGFHVRMLARHPELAESYPQVEVVPGNVLDEAALRSLFTGCDAVISTLGYRPDGAKNIFSTATRKIIRVMQEKEIRRYLAVAGLNVDAPTDKKSPKTRFATDWMKENYPETAADRQLELSALSQSDLDWTLVRVPMIRETDEHPQVILSLEDCPGDEITTASLAVFLVVQLSSAEFIAEAPFIANR
jgi:putative NADH-flavin reductase